MWTNKTLKLQYASKPHVSVEADLSLSDTY